VHQDELYSIQVQDYLIYIKANMGHCVSRLMCDMIQLLIMLGDNEYARAVILHTRSLMYHEACPRLPFTDMFTEDVGTFSEEAGEIAISVTTRYTLGDHTSDKLKHTNKMFRSIGLYRDLCRGDAHLGHTDCSDHHLPDLARTVASTSEHFRNVLRALQSGSWVYYSNANAYEVRGHAHRFNREPPTLVWRDVRLELQDRLITIDANFPRHWGSQFADLMGFVLPDRGVLEQPSDGEDGHVSDDVPQRRGRDRAHVLRRQPDEIRRPRARKAGSGSRSSSRGADDHTSTISENVDWDDGQGQAAVAASTGVASSVVEPILPLGGSNGYGREDEHPRPTSPSMSSRSMVVGASFEEAFVQTALRTRTVTRRRRRPPDHGPFVLQSPTP
jgi:hypothetical protein